MNVNSKGVGGGRSIGWKVKHTIFRMTKIHCEVTRSYEKKRNVVDGGRHFFLTIKEQNL